MLGVLTIVCRECGVVLLFHFSGQNIVSIVINMRLENLGDKLKLTEFLSIAFFAGLSLQEKAME